MKKLTVSQKLIYFINLIFSVFLLLSCIVPYVSVSIFSFFSFLSIAVPILVVINFSFFVYWILQWKRVFFVSFLVLIVGYFSLGSFLQFRKPSEKILEKDLSILTYNTFGFKGLKSGKKNIKNNGENIINFINKQNPDIICFQEFDYKRIKSGELDSYPYSYVDFEFGSKGKSIQAIYSKYKIINKGNFNFPNTANNAIFVDILYKEDTMRLYNVHLQSLNIRPRMIKDENSNKLYSRLASSFSKQEEQAKLILEDQKNNTHLKVICGDFNNTQYSNIYKLLKGDKNDTFIEKGSGYDRSYNFYHFPLRIDFILSDKELKVRSHKKFNLKYSDHFPVMASFSLE